MVTFDPTVIALLAIVEALYLRAVSILAGRGYRVPRLQRTAWHLGLGLLAVGLLGPLDHYADALVLSHMSQHLVIADLSAPFLLAGIRTPVLYFLLPRPALVTLARRRRLRRVVREIRRPMVALPIATLVLYAWHIGPLFEGALRHPALHALQHESFLIANLLVWWPVIEPKKRRMPGELWKVPYVVATRFPSMFLGTVFIAAQDPFYGAFYGDSARRYGLSPVADQQLGGGIMMSVDILIMVIAFSYFFWRAAVDDARAERAEAAGRIGAPA